jgi:hypothetical protein
MLSNIMRQTVLHAVQHNATDRTTCCPTQCDRPYYMLSNITQQIIQIFTPYSPLLQQLLIPPSFNCVNATEFHSRCLESCSQCSFIVQGEVLLKSPFLGVFTKLRRATISFVVSVSVCLFVRPSVRMEQLGFYWTDFHEI